MKTVNEFVYDLFMHEKALQLCFDILDLEGTGNGNISISVSVRSTDMQKQIAQLGVYYYIEQFNAEAQTHKYWSEREEYIKESQTAAAFSVSYDGNWTTNPDHVTRLGAGKPTILLRKEKDISPSQAKTKAKKLILHTWKAERKAAHGIH